MSLQKDIDVSGRSDTLVPRLLFEEVRLDTKQEVMETLFEDLERHPSFIRGGTAGNSFTGYDLFPDPEKPLDYYGNGISREKHTKTRTKMCKRRLILKKLMLLAQADGNVEVSCHHGTFYYSFVEKGYRNFKRRKRSYLERLKQRG